MAREKGKTVNVEKVGESRSDTGFSWNLTLDGKMDVEGHDVDLHNTINLQFGSLLDIKQKIIGELFGILANLGNPDKERLAQLVYITSKQVEKNMNLECDLKKMEKEILNFKGKYPELGAVFVRKVEELKKSLLEAQGDLGREKEYLEIYRIWIIKTVRKLEKLLDEAKKQGDLEKQQKYLEKYNMLLGDEFMGKRNSNGEVGLNGGSQDDWESLLSLSEDRAPRINLNIEGTSYVIKKGEKYDEDWRAAIKRAIESKKSNYGYDKNFVNFVLKIILRPFKVGEKYDEETIKYYVYSIIGCIEDNGGEVVQKIGKLYGKRKELGEKLDNLKKSLSLGGLSEIQDYSDIGKTDDFSLENISKFKKGIFCDILGKKLRDENLEAGDKEVVKTFLKDLNDSGRSEQFNFDTFFDNWSNGRIGLKNFGDKDNFLKCFSKILGFLGVEPENLSRVYERINRNTLGKDLEFRVHYLDLIETVIKKPEKTDEEKALLKMWNKNLDRNDTSKKIEKLKKFLGKSIDFTSLANSDKQLWMDFQNFCSDVVGNQPVDVKKRELEIRKIFGLGDENLINDGSLKRIVVNQMKKFNKSDMNDKDLVMQILKALVEKINEEKAENGKVIQRVLEEVNHSEMDDILKNVLDNIDVKIRQWLYEEYGLEEVNEEELEKIEEALAGIKYSLDDCCSLKECIDIEDNIEDVKKKIENNEYMVKLQKANQYLYQFNKWKDCNISEIKEPLKWLIVLKRFFDCKNLTLMEKLEYSEFIFSCIKKNDQKKSQKICSKKPEHDIILVDLFGEENVIKKNKDESQEHGTMDVLDSDEKFDSYTARQFMDEFELLGCKYAREDTFEESLGKALQNEKPLRKQLILALKQLEIYHKNKRDKMNNSFDLITPKNGNPKFRVLKFSNGTDGARMIFSLGNDEILGILTHEQYDRVWKFKKNKIDLDSVKNKIYGEG